jgi:hypothetical protein
MQENVNPVVLCVVLAINLLNNVLLVIKECYGMECVSQLALKEQLWIKPTCNVLNVISLVKLVMDLLKTNVVNVPLI